MDQARGDRGECSDLEPLDPVWMDDGCGHDDAMRLAAGAAGGWRTMWRLDRSSIVMRRGGVLLYM
jgi:hypothetical protein